MNTRTGEVFYFTEEDWRRRVKQGDSEFIQLVPEQPAKTKTGRNELCPCGSGKKFKRCCLGKRVQNA